MNELKKLIDSSQKKEWALMRIVLVSLTKANQFIKKNGRGLNYSLEGESMNIIMMSRKVDKTL